MGINKKGFRKVKYKGREYLWTVREVLEMVPEEGFVTPGKERYLHIISTNKEFIVRYRLPKPGDPFTFAYSEGRVFPRQDGGGRVRVPRWRSDSKRYPTADFVRRLIDWCMKPAAST